MKPGIRNVKLGGVLLLLLQSHTVILSRGHTAHGAEQSEATMRLFILSGQSNMVRLDPATSFTPAVTEAFKGDEVVVVKDAKGGEPIRRWHKQWMPPEGTRLRDPKPYGDLYDRLMDKVKPAIEGKKPKAIVFAWMQGERDAKTGMASVYEQSLKGLIQQLRSDLGREDIHVVIGRISDHGNSKFDGGWDKVREAQVKVAEDDLLAAWINTDDLNGDDNDLHYTEEGYEALGKRFAAQAIEMLAGK